MSQWIGSHVPSWLLLIGLIVVVAGGAVLTQRQVRRRYPVLAGDEHNDVTKFTYGFIGFVYAFFIGFVVSSMWGQINGADGNARAEGAAAVQMVRDSVVFDPVDGGRIRQRLLAYERAAIAEWPNAGDAQSREADEALAGLYEAYGKVQARNDTQKTLLATSYSNLDKISQGRTIGILTARTDTGPPWPLWAVIFVTSAMVLGRQPVPDPGTRPSLHRRLVDVLRLPAGGGPGSVPAGFVASPAMLKLGGRKSGPRRLKRRPTTRGL